MKTPDITPAQVKAALLAIFAVAASLGLPIPNDLQVAVLAVGAAVPSALLIADAIIRYGRSRAFGSAETLDRVEQPKKPA